jgi:hypothetical protein
MQCVLHDVSTLLLAILFLVEGTSGHHFFYLRNVLLRAGVFGNDAHLSMAVKLARAYEKFKSWQSSRGIRCSQPKFTEKMVPGICF